MECVLTVVAQGCPVCCQARHWLLVSGYLPPSCLDCRKICWRVSSAANGLQLFRNLSTNSVRLHAFWVLNGEQYFNIIITWSVISRKIICNSESVIVQDQCSFKYAWNLSVNSSLNSTMTRMGILSVSLCSELTPTTCMNWRVWHHITFTMLVTLSQKGYTGSAGSYSPQVNKSELWIEIMSSPYCKSMVCIASCR